MSRHHLSIISLFFIVIIIMMVGASWWISSGSSPKVRSNNLPLAYLWQYTSSHPLILPPLNNSKTVTIYDNQGKITALDLQTGEIRWSYHTGFEPKSLPSAPPNWAYYENNLILSPNRHELLALDTQTGSPVWSVSLPIQTWSMPTLLLIENVAVVAGYDEVTHSYLGGYDPVNGQRLWDRLDPKPRAYAVAFECQLNVISGLYLTTAVCVSQYDKLLAFDLSPVTNGSQPNQLPFLIDGISSIDVPRFKDGFIFTNPGADSTIVVYDLMNNDKFSLPTECRYGTAKPVTFYQDQVIVATGCNEIYLLDINRLHSKPDWVFYSPDYLLSSVVTMDGNVAYFLTEEAEVIGINLKTGKLIGSIRLSPVSLNRQRENQLIVEPPYLYLFLNDHHIFTFQQKE